VNKDDYTQIMVSMSEAAKCAFASLGSVEIVRGYCNCTNECYGDNRCKCFKKKYNCSSHCHPKLMGKTCKKCTNRKINIFYE
jgi:hypothetical protein